MAISRADLLKELLPGLNELFGLEYTAQRTQEKIDLILIDEAGKFQANKLEEYRLKQAGKTFREDVLIAHIKANELKKAEELQNAIQE